MSEPVKNTDRNLWREPRGDYYANSIHVTEGGGIGIDVGGTVLVKSLAQWHSQAQQITQLQAELASARQCIDSAGQLSTGWKHGNEGLHLLKIQSILSGNGAGFIPDAATKYEPEWVPLPSEIARDVDEYKANLAHAEDGKGDTAALEEECKTAEYPSYLTDNELQVINEWSLHYLSHERYLGVQCLLRDIKALSAECKRLREAESIWRELLWMAHSQGLGYGDDGEMQYRLIDYKRMSAEEIQAAIVKA